jgi:lipopolysaccharide transport protein LptA
VAASIRNTTASLASAALVTAVALGSCVAQAAAPQSPLVPMPALTPGAPITLDAQSADGTGVTESTYHKVRVAQGALSVTADLAHANAALDWEDIHLLFRGSVKMTLNDGQLTADDADVSFLHKLLTRAVAHGKPATLEQHSAKLGKTVQGRADTIEYDVAKHLVRLQGNAWISDGDHVLQGELVRYDLLEHTWTAEGADQNSQRVHITSAPPKSAVPAAPPAGAKP